jgi:hypothetical protein
LAELVQIRVLFLYWTDVLLTRMVYADYLCYWWPLVHVIGLYWPVRKANFRFWGTEPNVSKFQNHPFGFPGLSASKPMWELKTENKYYCYLKVVQMTLFVAVTFKQNVACRLPVATALHMPCCLDSWKEILANISQFIALIAPWL